MIFILAGAVAAVVSWAGNRLGLKVMGPRVIVVFAPLLEEVAKSGAAVLTKGSVIMTHGTFGLIEGVYDAWNTGLRGFKAGIGSFMGHLFYGYVTYLVMTKSNSFMFAVLIGYSVHMLWNLAVMKFIVTKRRVS